MSKLLWPIYFVESSDSSDLETSTFTHFDLGSRPAELSPESKSSSSDSCYTLKAYIPDRRVTVPFKTFLKKLISASEDGNSQVFRAELRVVANGGLTAQKRTVVCKVAYGERQIQVLRKESDLYHTKLLSLQGTVVPLMYGCYIDDTDDGRMGVLILQYCGVPLTYELKYYALTVRYQAVNALLAIHKAGVEHNDFAERNIVISKDKKGCPYVMVVDFGMASDHTCELQLDTIAPYGLAPTNREFLCDELYEVCRIADVWLPRYAQLFGNLIPVEHATSVDSILQHAYIPELFKGSRARECAQKAIEDVAEQRERRMAMDASPVPIEFDVD
ncbi:hypothetical protein OH76DRAFT_1387779 [Lentinus brumalis]|uniref:Protein kinase domain-containing protein n=1 Tax=Lentinus brumalis TaxID=2498619 RepID=A0A371CZ06_9APHY|nr:hypothetical protein OH76DRAFT_1387779 [Polyporus brumalis]